MVIISTKIEKLFKKFAVSFINICLLIFQPDRERRILNNTFRYL